MILLGWRTREDGAIVTWDLPSGPEKLIMLPADQRQAFDAGEAHYRELNEAAERKHGLPRGWLPAMQRQESGFNARAYRVERKKDGTPIYDKHGRLLTGVGLMQITNGELKGMHTDEELFDPSLNIEIGARYIAFLMSKYGDDFPTIAAAYNAGSPRKPEPGHENPWDLHQTAGHVSNEVAALNYFLAREQLHQEQELVYLEEVAVSREFDLRPDVTTLPPPHPDPLDEAPPTPRNDVPGLREAITLPDVRKRES
jgi:hypothetical protein